ncbi:MAG TPA: HDOD domain-containing protein [Steroidobacteraceae bacterium]|nr:HDOD domain-containing protein [Steroidobacteraceae bacterium]
MSNRSGSAPHVLLDARRLVAVELRERARDIPAAPFDWTTFDWQTVERGLVAGEGEAVDLRLASLQKLLCTAPARAAELRGLWNESVISAAYAWRLAPDVGGDPRTAAIAALLHRLGDLLTVRAIATIEHARQVRLDAVGRADLCAELGIGLLDRTVRAWGVPVRAAATAAEWRRLRDFPDAAADATAVYLGRLFALELIAPQFCAPGAVDAAALELGLPAARLSALRGDATMARLLVTLQ